MPADVGTAPVGRPPSAAATTAPSQPAGQAEKLRKEAFAQLLAGSFRDGLNLLEKLPAGQHEAVAEARALTTAYLELRHEAEGGRRSEYAAAVTRVKLARLAEKDRPAQFDTKDVAVVQPEPERAGSEEEKPAPQPRAKPAKKLYDGVEALADAVTEADRVLRVNPTSRPAELRKEAAKHLDKTSEKLSAVRKLIQGGRGPWGKAFAASLEGLSRAVTQYRDAWKNAALPDDWRKLKGASERVQDCMIDVGVLVARDPLVVALSHARQAKELAGTQTQEFLKIPWAAELIRDAEQRGRELVDEGEWAEALTIYGHGGLRDLDTDNVQYEQMVKQITLHVRMANLYGRAAGPVAMREFPPEVIDPEPPSTRPTTGPASASASLDEPRWREMIRGVDTEMIRRAISEIDSNYVDRPDYRKMGLGALEGIKVLLTTPEASVAFPGLKDQAKRRDFLAGLERQAGKLRREATPDHLTVVAALNGVVELNDRTVGLDPEVIDMEFAGAMLDELDKFTGMIWPYEEDDFRKRTMGLFCGIGVQIRKEAGRPIQVVTPLADTPAFRAGIRAGDLILAVDGRDTKTIRIERAVKLITGRRHTKVTLTIQRLGTPKPFPVTMVRDVIHIQTVKGWGRLPSGKWEFFLDRDAGVGYVRLTQFTADTADALRRALRQLRNAGAKGIILDVRFNPGGLLTAAVEVADQFLRQGLIVRTKGRNVSEAERPASALGEYQRGSLVVLANQFSASAAEIVAGALKDWKRAIIVGKRTYGKGSVQRLILLQSGRPARLKLTTAYYYLPAGRCLHRYNRAKVWGVDPDLPVLLTVRQMNRVAEVRQETDLLKKVDPELLGKLLHLQLREDIQLQTALLLLRLEQQAGKK